MKSGKTTAAKQLHAVNLSFAQPVKQIAIDCFGWDGIKDEKGRKLLQLIGTDCGRAYNPNIWIDKMREQLKEHEPFAEVVTIDDLRFDNEADLVHEFGGVVIGVKRKGCEPSEHQSEKGISPEKIDLIITNNGTIQELQDSILLCID